MAARTQVGKKTVRESLPNLNTERLSFKKRNAISARHDFVFRSASIPCFVHS
jgi:hypothetical protein